jgi:hypothetical protein
LLKQIASSPIQSFLVLPSFWLADGSGYSSRLSGPFFAAECFRLPICESLNESKAEKYALHELISV